MGKNVKQTFNSNKVKACIAEKGITQTKLAKYLNISLATLNLKLNDKKDFKIGEIQAIAYYFKKDIGYFFD